MQIKPISAYTNKCHINISKKYNGNISFGEEDWLGGVPKRSVLEENFVYKKYNFYDNLQDKKFNKTEIRFENGKVSAIQDFEISTDNEQYVRSKIWTEGLRNKSRKKYVEQLISDKTKCVVLSGYMKDRDENPIKRIFSKEKPVRKIYTYDEKLNEYTQENHDNSWVISKDRIKLKQNETFQDAIKKELNNFSNLDGKCYIISEP